VTLGGQRDVSDSQEAYLKKLIQFSINVLFQVHFLEVQETKKLIAYSVVLATLYWSEWVG